MSSTSSTVFPSNPTTPPFSDNLEWTTAYITIHSLSVPSRRYSFLLWIAVVFVFLAFAVLHWSGAKGGVVGAHWSKWTLPRRTWRKHAGLGSRRHKREVISLPSNAQLLSLFGIVVVPIALALIGPDYVAPALKVWQFSTRGVAAQPHELYDASSFDQYVPQYTIPKSLWSSSARFGQIAFALFPLCVLFALKAPPFALFAIPFMIQLFFEKLVWLHRWSGRLIWLLTAVHVVLWSIQLARDHNPNTGRPAYVYAFMYEPFIYGWVAFALLTFIVIFSLHPIRRHFYESFYLLHVLLVPLTLLTASLHHPPVAFWCWAALAVWIGERLWRLSWWVYSNGLLRNVSPTPAFSVPIEAKPEADDSWEMGHVRQSHPGCLSSQPPLETQSTRTPSPLSPYYDHDRPATPVSILSPRASARLSQFTVEPSPIKPAPPPYIPPPGYAHAELLPGHTVRLRLVTPRLLTWAPGQHFLLHIPSISRFESHPFTCASICDEQARGHDGRLMVFLVRTRKGWTQDLWDTVARMTVNHSRADASSLPSASLPTQGVILRAFVDGPFGSSVRARWGDHSTAVIVTGGSGVSFGLSVLQFLCHCLSGRDARHLGSRPGGLRRKAFVMKRVRFIWLVREYSHVQWCASIIRRCMSIVPPSSLQVDIYVTNFKPVPARLPVPPSPSFSLSRLHLSPTTHESEELEPPHPRFARGGAHSRSRSSDSVDSHESNDSDVEFTYYTGDYSDDDSIPEDPRLAHDTNILELTNFHGEEDMVLPGEKNLSMKVRDAGKLRRQQSRQSHDSGRNSEPGVTTTLLHVRPDRHPPPLRIPKQSTLSTYSIHSTDRLIPASPLSEHRRSNASDSDSPSSSIDCQGNSIRLVPSPSLTTLPDYSTASLVVPPPAVSGGVPASPAISINRDTKTESRNSRPALPPLVTHPAVDLLGFEINDQEAVDVDVISERVRPGKPKLDKLIAGEVERSGGSVVVACEHCCGPTSLDAMVRKIIAKQINPERIRRGDMRGSITLVSEEFEY
ncbi:hypothetical protein ID866_5437 [Astraeus odoratus]|nr:hypothetical protein ID866_5437 [Astraeus odoratus]